MAFSHAFFFSVNLFKPQYRITVRIIAVIVVEPNLEMYAMPPPNTTEINASGL